MLGNLLKVEGFDYESSEEVRDELKKLVEGASNAESSSRAHALTVRLSAGSSLTRISEWPIYRTDSLVRRAEPLQHLPTQKQAAAYMNSKTAKN